MENIDKFSEITINEHVETKRVKKRYDKALEEIRALIIIPLIFVIIFVACSFIFMDYDEQSVFICFIVLSAVSIIILYICAKIRNSKIAIYRELYRIARRNDEIRYDEKIRYLERKRLDMRFDNIFNKQNVKQTLKYPENLDEKQ